MSKVREWMFGVWYRYVNNIDKNAEILFMNYGYSDPQIKVDLDQLDESNRYSIQLYHLLGSAVEIQNKDIAEIGCGRGGGLSYIVRKFSPATAIGVDIDKSAVKFCNRFYKLNGLSFLQGNAQELSFLKDSSCDVIINNESSHRYPKMDKFLNEVHRILRPGGYLVFADFRFDHDLDGMFKHIENSGFDVLKKVDITENVISALKLDDQRKRLLVKKLAPRPIRKIALNFAGTIGSDTFNKFVNREYQYFHYLMQKK